LLSSGVFLSESAYNSLTGEELDIPAGMAATVLNDDGGGDFLVNTDFNLVTNPVTGQVLRVEPVEEPILNSVLFGRHVLDDADYETITAGLTDAWDPIGKLLAEREGEPYWVESEQVQESSLGKISYEQRDSSAFRMFWKYMPKFRSLDIQDFYKTTAVFITLFAFVALVCFAAVVVIAYTRSITIGLNNAQVYRDLTRLGADNRYLFKTLKGQISKVFFVPIFTGTAVISVFYSMIMFFNDNGFSASEIAGLGNCVLLVAAVSGVLYGFYRSALGKVCGMTGVRKKSWNTNGSVI
jgi:hypothetical protein